MNTNFMKSGIVVPILTPIDKDSVYVFLEINKLRNDNSFNRDGVMQKSYIIDSEKLVEFINENT